MRAVICSLVSRSVNETLIVRSKGRKPLWTLTSVASVLRIARLQPITVRRKRLRVTSIFLARAISSSRFKSGISAICERYMRIGSLLHLLMSGGGGGASAAAAGDLAVVQMLVERFVGIGLLGDVEELRRPGLRSPGRCLPPPRR